MEYKPELGHFEQTEKEQKTSGYRGPVGESDVADFWSRIVDKKYDLEDRITVLGADGGNNLRQTSLLHGKLLTVNGMLNEIGAYIQARASDQLQQPQREHQELDLDIETGLMQLEVFANQSRPIE